VKKWKHLNETIRECALTDLKHNGYCEGGVSMRAKTICKIVFWVVLMWVVGYLIGEQIALMISDILMAWVNR